ncbi:MAG: hypothetical protein AB7Y46_01025 [Armatimonadota bacterium]
MHEPVYRFMPARELMNLVAGNWASWQSDLPSEREPHPEDGSVVDVPWVRFSLDQAQVRASAACRGGIVTLDISPLTEAEEYLRRGPEVYVLADVLVGEPLTIELRP